MIKVFLINSRGYTLVELLVAISLLGLVVAPFLGLITTSFTFISEAGMKTAATNLALEKMERIKACGFEQAYNLFILEEMNPQIEESIPRWENFTRKTEVSKPCPVELGLPFDIEVLEVLVTVSWKRGDREKSVILASKLCRR